MKQIKKNWILIVEIIIGTLAIAGDAYFNLKVEWFTGIISHIFDTLVVVAGFWVTLYLLFLELYKDRYPLKFLESKYLNALKRNILNIAFCAMYGLVVISRKDYLIESIFYVLVSISTIIIIGVYVYNTSKTMMVTNYVESFCKDISERFAENNSKIEKSALDDLNRVFEECIIKEEYSVAQKISNCAGDVFRDFMKKSIEFIDNGDNRNQVEKSYRRIAKFGGEQLKKCKEIESSILKEDIIRQQYNNLKFCIDTNQFEFFKIYIEILIKLTNYAEKNRDNELVTITYDLYRGVLEDIIKQNKDEWVNYMLTEIYESTRANSYFYSDDYVKDFVSLITYGLIKCENDDTFKVMFKMFEDITVKMSTVQDGFSSMIMYYIVLFSEIKNNKKEYLETYTDLVLGDDCILSKDVKWIEFKFHCLSEIDKLYDQEKVSRYRIHMLTQIIEMKDSYRGYFSLPNFKEKVYESTYSQSRLDKVCSEFRVLFEQSIISDNIGFFYMLIKRHAECLLASDISQKDIQKDLFENYMWLVKRTKRLNNKQFFEMTFASMEDVITKLDGERNISAGFGDIIIQQVEKMGLEVDSRKGEIILRAIELLHSFIDEDEPFIFCNKTEKKRMIVRGIYNIGINCVENDYEEGVRKASNSLGWLTISAMKQGITDLVKYTLELADKMLDISKKMNVSSKTETFIMTLFTTVGMYCYKDPAYHIYKKLIENAINGESKEIINTAIEIRTYENDMWDSLMENKTQEYASQFRKDFLNNNH